MSEKQMLLNDIAKLCFARHDTVLYLDTHPKDSVALDYYHYTGDLLKEAQAKYIADYGPITNADVTNTECFDWVNAPWPWEGGCL